MCGSCGRFSGVSRANRCVSFILFPLEFAHRAGIQSYIDQFVPAVIAGGCAGRDKGYAPAQGESAGALLVLAVVNLYWRPAN
jgi:hypothetical protein